MTIGKATGWQSRRLFQSISDQRQYEKSTVDSLAREIEALLPGLRRYARHLTDDAAAVDDLVQETVARGIEKIRLWRQGTDLRAWLSTVLHNLYVSGIRRASRNRAMLGAYVYPSRRSPVSPSRSNGSNCATSSAVWRGCPRSKSQW